jgi:hypothetical protein
MSSKFRIKLVCFAHNLSRASLREPQGLTTESNDKVVRLEHWFEGMWATCVGGIDTVYVTMCYHKARTILCQTEITF